jgi:hypothetical protein
MKENGLRTKMRWVTALLTTTALLLAAFGLGRAGVLAPPVVIDLEPDAGVHTAPVDTSVSVTYDQDMDSATVNPQTFAVHARQTGWLTETLSVSGGTITLDPLSDLHAGELVETSATTATLSLGGEAPLEPTVWQFTTQPWGGNAAFHEHQIITGGDSRDAALGDLDGDGDLDVLTTSCFSNLHRVYHNDGRGTFTLVQTFTSNACLTDVELGDLDGDGDLDAVLINYWSNGDKVLWNNGDGTFTDSGQLIYSDGDTYGELGDLDGDGDLDLLVASGGYGPGTLRVWLNDGNGYFSLKDDFDTPYEHMDVRLGDLDGDGDLDAFTAGWNGSYNKVWFNDGTGAFSEVQVIPNAHASGAQLGDLDDDGDLDVYLANTAVDDTDLPDEVWWNDGHGYFTNSGQSLGTVLSAFPALGDLDADGDLDVYLSGGKVAAPDEVWANDGAGVFTPFRTVNENHPGGLVNLGDLDNDGNLDAFAASDDPTVSFQVYLNGDWTQAANIPEAMFGSGVQCPEQPDSFYLVGGVTTFGDTDAVYRYDAAPDGGSWAELASMPQPMRGQAVACYQGKIYVAGGWYSNTIYDTLYIYDIAMDTWSQRADLPNIVWSASMGAWDGKLYLAGGTRGGNPWPPVSRVDVYDIASDTWTAGGGRAMLFPTSAAASVQAGPYLYIAGGIVGDGIHLHDEVQRYDMASNTWELGPSLTIPQWGGDLAINGSRLYILGGVDDPVIWNPLDKVDVLELADWPGGAWADFGDRLPQANLSPKCSCTEAMSGGEVWATGGGFSLSLLYDTNLYHPAEPCLGYNYALALDPAAQDGSGKPGEVVTYTLTVTNSGDTPDAYSVLVTSDWAAEAPEMIGALDPGKSAELLVTVEVPDDASPDEQDTATLLVTSQGDHSQDASASLTTTALAVLAHLGVAHLAPFAIDPGTAVTVTLDGAVVLTGFEFTDSSGYISVTANLTHTVEVFAAGVPTPAISAEINLLVGKYYSAIAVGGANDQTLELLALEDDNTPPASGFFHLRLGHLAPFAATITDTLADVRLQDGPIILDDVPYGAVTGFTPLPAGIYDLVITSPDGLVTYIDPLPVTFNEGDIVSAYAVGDGANQPLGVFAWPADAEGFLLPLVIYGVELSPAQAAQSAHPGHMVEYTLTLTNAGNITDTFDLALEGNEWLVTLPVTPTELAAGESIQVTVQVLVPVGAANGALDSVTITATSQGDPAATASSELTTTAVVPEPEEFVIFLPFMSRE